MMFGSVFAALAAVRNDRIQSMLRYEVLGPSTGVVVSLLRICCTVRVQPSLKLPADDDQVQSGSFHGSQALMFVMSGRAFTAAIMWSTRLSQSGQPPQL